MHNGRAVEARHVRVSKVLDCLCYLTYFTLKIFGNFRTRRLKWGSSPCSRTPVEMHGSMLSASLFELHLLLANNYFFTGGFMESDQTCGMSWRSHLMPELVAKVLRSFERQLPSL